MTITIGTWMIPLLASIAVFAWACVTPLKAFGGFGVIDFQALGHALLRWMGVFIVIASAWSVYFFAT